MQSSLLSKKGKVILSLLILSILFISPVLAYDVNCTNTSNVAITAAIPSEGGATSVYWDALNFQDVGERTGFKSLVIKADTVEWAIDGGAPDSAWTPVTFTNDAGTVTYGTGIIGYNRLIDESKHQVFINVDECGIFSGLDGQLHVRMIYNLSAIYHIRPSKEGSVGVLPGSEVVEPSNVTTPGASMGFPVGSSHVETQYDCYDISVGINIDEAEPSIDWNTFYILREGWNSYFNITTTGGTIVSSTGVLDESGLVDADYDTFDYYIHLIDSDHWCNGTYNISPVGDTLTFRAIDTTTLSLLDETTFVIYRVLEDEYANGTEAVNEFSYEGIFPTGDLLAYYANRTGYTGSGTFFRTVAGDETIDIYLYPVGSDANNTLITFYVYWKQGAVEHPIPGAVIGINGVSASTNSVGVSKISVPNNATYPYTVTKAGFFTFYGNVTVTTGTKTVEVQMIPTAAITTAATPTVTTVPTTSGPGGIFVDRLAGIFGNFFLAALIIFAFMIGGGWAANTYTGGGYMGVIAGGVMGFIVTVFLGIISIAWLFAAFALTALIVAGVKIYGGSGG